MWQIPVKPLLLFAQFLLTIIWITIPFVNSEGPMDYFDNFFTTTEITFAHIPNGNINDNTGSGQWTRLDKCEPGSFITSHVWFVNASTGSILGLGADCKRVTADESFANSIEALTIPRKMMNDPLVHRFGSMSEKNEFAVGFSMRTTDDEKTARIEARQLIINGKQSRKCPKGDSNCRLHQFRCKSNFALCGFQAKVMGGNGTFGGSITNMRFHCCYICNAEPLRVQNVRNFTSVDHPKSFYHNGTYGYSSKYDTALKTPSGNAAPPPVHYLEKSCGLLSDYDEDYVDPHERSTECETSKVVEITGRINTDASMWESIFKDFKAHSGARAKRNIHEANETLPEIRMNTKEVATFLEKFKNDIIVETDGIKTGKFNQTECFVCEAGDTCIVQQTVWNCYAHYLENPAVLVKKPLQSNDSNSDISEDGWIAFVSISNIEAPKKTDRSLVECPDGHFIIDDASTRAKRNIAESENETKLRCAGISPQHHVPIIGFRLSKATSGADYVHQPLYFRTAGAPSCGESSNTGTNEDREVFCPPEHAVCGLKYSNEQTPNETSTSSFRFKCCYHCVPEEHMHSVATTQNNGDGPRNFKCNLKHAQNTSDKRFSHILRIFTEWFDNNNSVSGFNWTRPDIARDGEGKQNPVAYDCPAGHMCRVRQLTGRCGQHVVPTTSYTVQLLKKEMEFQEDSHPHFIFSYGPKGEEEELACPVGSIATAIRVKSELGLGMTGLEMECSHLKAHHKGLHYTSWKVLKDKLSTETGRWTDENVSFSAPITGFYFNWSKGEETAEGLRVSFGPLIQPEDAHPGDESKFCPDHHAICGFSYWTDAKSKVIKELKLKCCCIPRRKSAVLLGSAADSNEESIGKVAVKVGLVDRESTEEHQEVDFESRSVLQTLFSLRFRRAVYWNRANFNKLTNAFVSRYNRHDGSKDHCELWQDVITCGRYEVYTARVKGACKGP